MRVTEESFGKNNLCLPLNKYIRKELGQPNAKAELMNRLLALGFLLLGLWSCQPSPQAPRGASPASAAEEQLWTAEQLLADLPAGQAGQLVRHQFYQLSYRLDAKNAEWAMYRIDSQSVADERAPRRSGFIQDPELGRQTASDADYRGSGFDRGHLIPAEDMDFDPKAMDESFYLSNVSPQDPSFNRGIWKKLEGDLRDWALEKGDLLVITGPVLPAQLPVDAPKIAGDILVPSAFYKVIVDLKARKSIAFLLANEKSDAELASFALSIRELENKTGLNFFPKLSVQQADALEQQKELANWFKD